MHYDSTRYNVEFTSSILIHLSEIKKTENGENKENEPNRNSEHFNGISNTENPEIENINTEIEIDAITTMDDDFEIQNIGTDETKAPEVRFYF